MKEEKVEDFQKEFLEEFKASKNETFGAFVSKVKRISLDRLLKLQEVLDADVIWSSTSTGSDKLYGQALRRKMKLEVSKKIQEEVIDTAIYNPDIIAVAIDREGWLVNVIHKDMEDMEDLDSYVFASGKRLMSLRPTEERATWELQDQFNQYFEDYLYCWELDPGEFLPPKVYKRDMLKAIEDEWQVSEEEDE